MSSTVWKLVEEKAAGGADLAELRQVLDAIDKDAPETFRKIVEKQIASVDFFQKPIDARLEAAAINGVLSVVSDADAFRRLRPGRDDRETPRSHPPREDPGEPPDATGAAVGPRSDS